MLKLFRMVKKFYLHVNYHINPVDNSINWFYCYTIEFKQKTMPVQIRDTYRLWLRGLLSTDELKIVCDRYGYSVTAVKAYFEV